MSSVASNDEFLASMLGDFIDESTDHVHALNKNLLELDELFQSLEPNAVARIEAQQMNEMFRATHSLKGLSAMLGLNDMKRLTHKLENVFDAARSDELRVKREVVSVVLTAVDHLSEMIDALKDNGELAIDVDAVESDIEKLFAGKQISQDAMQPTESKSNSKEDERNSIEVTEFLDDTRHAAEKCKLSETLRVDVERLDHLMLLADQLVINTEQLGQLGSRLDKLTTDCREVDLVEEALSVRDDLSATAGRLSRISRDIQQSVIDTRMAPVGPLFERFQRVIRDITRDTGKDVRLNVEGGTVKLDKRMIDELGDPLIHMARNSADHGIESRQERVAAGKPPQGQVTLAAIERGNRVLVQVRDDGRGLDPEKILATAIRKGIVTPAQAEHLCRREIFQLIWIPSFSTADQITDISGRGVGMDIVKSKIEAIGGNVELDSNFGVGTTITIELPLSVTTLPAT